MLLQWCHVCPSSDVLRPVHIEKGSLSESQTTLGAVADAWSSEKSCHTQVKWLIVSGDRICRLFYGAEKSRTQIRCRLGANKIDKLRTHWNRTSGDHMTVATCSQNLNLCAKNIAHRLQIQQMYFCVSFLFLVPWATGWGERGEGRRWGTRYEFGHFCFWSWKRGRELVGTHFVLWKLDVFCLARFNRVQRIKGMNERVNCCGN